MGMTTPFKSMPGHFGGHGKNFSCRLAYYIDATDPCHSINYCKEDSIKK